MVLFGFCFSQWVLFGFDKVKMHSLAFPRALLRRSAQADGW